MSCIKPSKWKKYPMSKALYKTKQTRGSGNAKGINTPGHVEARKVLAVMLNRSAEHMRVQSGKGKWVFSEPMKGVANGHT